LGGVCICWHDGLGQVSKLLGQVWLGEENRSMSISGIASLMCRMWLQKKEKIINTQNSKRKPI